jgi:hypothetical protein
LLKIFDGQSASSEKFPVFEVAKMKVIPLKMEVLLKEYWAIWN